MNKYQEALNKIVKSCCPDCSMNGCKDCSIEKICNTKQWVDTLQELVDKATPKKPKPVEMFGHTIMRRCPVCNTRPLLDHSLYYKQKYCDNCGQALDWSDEDGIHKSQN